jgi:hypothetical protein
VSVKAMPSSEAHNHADAVSDYAKGVRDSIADKLAPICDEFEARIRGFDVHGRPLDRPGVPTQAEIDAVLADSAALSRDLDDEQLDVEIPQPDGSKRVTRNAHRAQQRYGGVQELER